MATTSKEVLLHEGSAAERRFVVVRNPEEAERDRAKREDIVREVERRLGELKQLSGKPHTKAACELRSHPVFGRCIRQTKTGELRLNKTKIAAEREFDGKYLISASDQWLDAEDVVNGYKQLWLIERVFRDLKHVVDIRLVFHRKGDRIRAHVLLCWLALVLIRLAERDTETTWSRLKMALYSLQAGLCRNSVLSFSPTTALTSEQKAIFNKLQLDPPPTMLNLTRREA